MNSSEIRDLEQNETDAELHLVDAYRYPTMIEYYENLSRFVLISLFISSLLLILNFSIYFATVMQLRQRLNKPLLNISIALCSPYPIISIAAMATLLMPKSWLICHTIMHLSFTICGIIFHRLCINYMESESNFIKMTDGNAVAINTPPCCCCCLCLPQLMPSKLKFSLLKYFIWQMPLVQGAIMFALCGIYYTEPEFYNAVFKYFMPFVICSILLGVWGVNIVVRMVVKLHTDYNMTKKMFCLQLILLLCKLQYLLMDKQLDVMTLGGDYPMNHIVYKQTIINLLILVEMTLVSALAQHAYKTPVQNVRK